MPNTKYWEDLGRLLNRDLEGKRNIITYISGCMRDQCSLKKIREESKSYRDGAAQNLAKLGIKFSQSNLLWKDDDYDRMVYQILSSDVVYLLGGNPMQQMKFISDHNLKFVLQDYSGIIIGVSSGAMTMSSKIILPACGEVYPENTMLDGIDLFGISVFPHFDYHSADESLTVKDGVVQMDDLRKLSQFGDIIGLPNESILRCAEDGICAIGDMPSLLIDGEIKQFDIISDQVDDVKVKKLVYGSCKNNMRKEFSIKPYEL